MFNIGVPPWGLVWLWRTYGINKENYQ